MNDRIAQPVRLPKAPPDVAADPVLRRARQRLEEIYGPNLAGVILYGSRARGDHRPDSDYDILVLIEHWERGQSGPLHDLALELFSFGPPEVNVNFLPRDARALERRTIFMHNVREEGVQL